MVFCSVFVGSHIEFQVRTNCACRGTAPSVLGFCLELGCGTTRSCKIAFYPGIVGIWNSMVLSFFSPNCFVTSLGVLLNLLVLNLRRVSKSVSYIGCFHHCMLVYSSWWIRCKTPALCWCIWIMQFRDYIRTLSWARVLGEIDRGYLLKAHRTNKAITVQNER
jgi:hypothetical protein